jgi:AbiV family abortive infection protein
MKIIPKKGIGKIDLHIEKIDLALIDEARRLVLDNAKSLIEESEILFKKQKYARAFTLAHLAGEELAKIPMLFRYGMYIVIGKNIDIREFDKKFRNHKSKIKGISAFDFMTNPIASIRILKDDIKFTDNYDSLKNMGLYVSGWGIGFISPLEIFDKEMANNALTLARFRFKKMNALEKHQIKFKSIQKNEILFKDLKNFASELDKAIENPSYLKMFFDKEFKNWRHLKHRKSQKESISTGHRTLKNH